MKTSVGSPSNPPPTVPVLLTSLASAVLLDGRGDLELPRETRGAVIDWGGVYGQLIRLSGPWRLSLSAGSGVTALPDCLVDVEKAPGRWRSRHRLGRFEFVQDVTAVPSPSGAVRTLSFSVPEGPAASLLLVSTFAPFLLPVLVEGIRPTSFHVETASRGLTVRQRGFALDYRSSLPPSRMFLNRAAWAGGRFEGPVEQIASHHELTVTPGHPAVISFLLSGGLERDLGPTSAADTALSDPDAAARAIDTADQTWQQSTPILRFPNDPALERAYEFARAALRRLYTSPGEGLTGLVAGYPWYSSIWCRDLAWMLPATLWLGDFDWVAQSLASVFRFQLRAEVPMLGGEPGELPMQISPGPIFLYGTSDTTLYYPGLVAQYVRHSGKAETAAAWSTVIERILRWGQARTDPDTGLLRHGGEAEEIATATEQLSRVRYGIDSPDTTIWDSVNRREHAIDVQVLWRQALLAAAELQARGANPTPGRDWVQAADRIARSVREFYPWSEEGYLYDSRLGGKPVARLRPNALRAVTSGILDRDLCEAIVKRAAKEDLTTPWGVRTLSAKDPGYDPQSYHDGEVWTIATAWAAEAALAVGDSALGMRYLRTIGERMDAEGGWANECYRGDRPEAFDSCFLLGFSVAPFLTTLFERLWGLSVDARVPRLEVAPCFPLDWDSASLEQLRVGSGVAALDWTPKRTRISWSGAQPLQVSLRAGNAVVPPGGSVDLPAHPSTT
ncbi:MAG: amylo-alpha-1,6-glucosidase [Thermoplasmata archaeon]